ncbi:YlmH family RNA-binding protein [Fusibacter tunisiensis]|uniref:RNA-binding protein YlmH n=1 Tax=Fusibacter tunisiensis TaxID=1008308 RepID=A0ABS2MM84_9FIRM|nr:YlmH/Sll1252 family protein [Fusibacter tunisiensis]MBM7560515.1 RNA-binding protein YlmH [Fusibacter tunisiensis]
MNKNTVLKQYAAFLDEDGIFLKTLDLLIRSDLYYEASMTDFITPDMAYAFNQIASQYTELNLMPFGVFEGAERVRLCFYPEFSEPCDVNAFIALLEFEYNDKFNTLAHKDVLGALMGLGIQRNRVGDIVLSGSKIQMAVDCELETYILAHLDQIGRAGVSGNRIPLDMKFEKDLKLIRREGTVKSLRLDALIALAMGISRSEAQKCIASESVKVNYKVCEQTAQVLKQGDLVSVRKKGRFILEEISGVTRKDRIRVSLSFYSR